MRIDERAGEITVFTFKEGLLSAMGHDLALRVGRFTVDVEGQTVRADIDMSSLRVLHAVVHSAPDERALSAKDRADIEKSARDVLHVDKHPRATFEGALNGGRLEGTLTLCGVRRSVSLSQAGAGAFEATLDQPSYGIRPFRAALGALKIKPEVRVRVRLDPFPSGEPAR